MAMCIHSQEYETCIFGCTFRKKEELKIENDRLQTELEKYKEVLDKISKRAYAAHSSPAEHDQHAELYSIACDAEQALKGE